VIGILSNSTFADSTFADPTLVDSTFDAQRQLPATACRRAVDVALCRLLDQRVAEPVAGRKVAEVDGRHNAIALPSALTPGGTMNAAIEVESTLTDRYQTTVPETVRRALRLRKRDKIHFTIRPDGDVVLTRVEAPDPTDPALTPFLALLAADIAMHPDRLRSLDAEFAARIGRLVDGVDVDLDSALSESHE
jgi:antitoxin PrlF